LAENKPRRPFFNRFAKERAAQFPPEDKEYQTGGWKAHWILIVTALLYAINQMDRNVVTVVAQPMKLELGLTDAQVGLIQTVFMIFLALFAIPVAFLVDRWSRKKSIAIMAVLWSVATFATGLGKNFIGILIPRAFVGLGEAGYTPGGVAMTTAAYKPEKHGRVMGIYNAALPLGHALGVIVGGIISVRFGWQYAFFMFAIPGVLLGIAALFLKDYKTVKAAGDGKARAGGMFKSLGVLLKTPTIPWIYLGFAAMMFTMMAVSGWSPAVIMRQFKVREDMAGLLSGITVIAGVLGVIIGGLVNDALTKKSKRARLLHPAIACLTSGILLVVAMLAMNFGIWAYLVVAFLFAFIFNSGMGPLMAATQEVVAPERKGQVWGLNVFFHYLLGGAWGPYAVGAVSDSLGGNTESLKTALMLSASILVVAAFCYFMGSRKIEADMDKVKHEKLMA
jgi:MFS family permease